MIIEAVSNAQTILQEIGEANIQKFDEECIRKVDIQLKETRYAKVISESSTIKSIAVNINFLQQKKSGFVFQRRRFSTRQFEPSSHKKNPDLAKKKYKMSRCSALLPIKCRDNKDIKELAAIGLGGVNLEKPVGGGRITVVFDKKDVPDSDMREAMELGEKLVRYGVKFDEYKSKLENNENILCPSKKQKNM